MQIEMIPVAIDDDIDADSEGFEDLGQAMSNGRTTEMERCVAAILETPAQVMPPEQKFRLLWLRGGLNGAVSHAQADTAARDVDPSARGSAAAASATRTRSTAPGGASTRTRDSS